MNPTKVKVLKGCRELEISKGSIADIVSIVELGAEYSHTVKLVLQFPGRKFVLYARHINRVREETFNLNNGNPLKKIVVKGIFPSDNG
jgi:hypothetical protein